MQFSERLPWILLTAYFAACTVLANDAMRLVYSAYGLSATDIENALEASFGESHTSSARLNHYPAYDPLPVTDRADVNGLGDMALHHHTDPGAITLLLQDSVGGLQTLSGEHGWIDVPPATDTFVVNLGDVLQVWTNNRYVAATHRVLPVPGVSRYSTPFFFQPRFDAVVEPWCLNGERPQYRPFSWREFIMGRVTDNYADYGADDIQISKYLTA